MESGVKEKITVTTMTDPPATYCVLKGAQFVLVDLHPASIGRDALMKVGSHDWLPVGTVRNIDPAKSVFRVAVAKSDLAWWLERFGA